LLFKSTPEGAREFLVPADDDGYAYALPQSPQQFKQMLMAAGFDRYYQIARCFRNEDLRADRQPEFTQLDVEMAFVEDESCVMAVMEEAVQALMRRFAPTEISGGSFPRLRYAEVMARYGCDKPDTRYPFTIETVKESGDSVTEALDLSTLPSGFDLPTEERIIKRERSLREHSGSTALGRIRSEVIRRIEAAGLQSRYRIEGETGWLWVHRFPLFNALSGEDPLQAGRRFEPLHHPFTAPLPEDAHLLKTDPALVHGQHYDLVWRGVEVGGGSIRIHSPALQEFVLRDVIGLPQSHLAHFDHLLRALRSGCPPHGGMALGLDRLIAMLHGAASIRDVIAFPKNGRGHDLCVNAPSQIKP
jgi:aspartyl-tRNA synthetase